MSVTFLNDVRASARLHGDLKDRIKAAFNLEDGDQALADTLEGESDFHELCGKALREAKAREAMAEGLSGLIKDMQSRKARLDHSADSIRAMIAEAMLDAQETKLALPDMTVSVRMGKSRLIIDADTIPDRFKVAQPITFKPNKEAIQEAVDHGEVPNGVQIANPQPVITVRIK